MLIRRIVRFTLAGGLTTAVAYVTWMILLRFVSYPIATALAWLIAVAFGFVVNRRYTFGITGSERRGVDSSLFLVGAVGQLLIGEACYYVTIGRLGMAPTWAFLINLGLNTTFGFVFHNFVTFRRASLAPVTRPASSDRSP